MRPRCISARSSPARLLIPSVTLGLLANLAPVTGAYAGSADTNGTTVAAAATFSVEAQVQAAEPCLVVIAVTVSDPDRTPISSLTADFSGLPEGNDATFVADAANRSGTFIWHPGEANVGDVAFTAAADGQSASKTVNVRLAPDVNAGGVFRWTPTQADLGTYMVTFTAQSSLGEIGSATFPLTVISDPSSAGTTARSDQRLSAETPTRGPIISFGGCSQCGGGGGKRDTVNVDSPYTESFELFLVVIDPDGIVSFTVDTSDLPPDNTATFNAIIGPTANAGGPYVGFAGVPVAFDGGASSSGDFGLDLVWDFGDAMAGQGVTPSHAYASAGMYHVTMVANASLGFPDTYANCDTTSVLIQDALPARAFIGDGHRTTPDTPDSRSLCIQIEPVDGSYDNTQVDGSSILMYSDLAPATPPITALSDKTMYVGDRDRNGIQEITACFSRDDFARFLAGAQSRTSLPVTITARVGTGAMLRANMDLLLVDTGASLAASVRPNPLRRTGAITFDVATPGPLVVQLFDLNGRLVRTLLSLNRATIGHYELPFDRLGGQGRSIASGIYFYKVKTADAVATGRFVVLH